MPQWNNLMKIAILTSPNQWFIPFAKKLQENMADATLFFRHEDIDATYETVFILSYHRIIESDYLEQHKHNIVIHASALPKGKGWAPLFWQILEGKNEIPFTMFEASLGVDDGDIYMEKTLLLTGFELNAELRLKQAELIVEMCLEFIDHYKEYTTPRKQMGESTFYPKRSAKDSQLDIHKSLYEQFNLLRIVDNDAYPAFFEIDGHHYILKIESCI